MDPLICYLSEIKHNLNGTDYDKIHVVVGNESCDLDSTVSALAYAFYLHTNNKDTRKLIIPVMNIQSEEFPLRTENCFCLKKVNINLNYLLYRDTIDFKKLQEYPLTTTLVDHHVLAEHESVLKTTVLEIFDHRPFDDQSNWNDNVKIVLEEVGSCCTLIANEILKCYPDGICNSLMTLLYETIVFDTIGFNEEAAKAKPLDYQVATALEKILRISPNRKETFEILWEAHNDVSPLTAKQLLSKDVKFLKNVCIPGLPMLVKNYLALDGVSDALESYSNDKNCLVLILMGLEASGGVFRDLAIFANQEDEELKRVLLSVIQKHSEFNFQRQTSTIPKVTYFIQGNAKLSRKQLLPVIKDAISEYNKT